MSASATQELRMHGDRLVRAGMLDFAVNVWRGTHEAGLLAAMAEALRSTSYPDQHAARAAIASRHRRPLAETMALAGACEAFWLLAHALPIRHAVCIHPSFTEAEAALRAAGRRVSRVARRSDDFALQVDAVPEEADFVVLANPNNPTGNLDSPDQIERLARPGRTLLLDESFIDFVCDAEASLAERQDLPGLVVLRSLTKLWALPGVRAGYLLASADVVGHLEAHRQPWSVSAPALAAIAMCLADVKTPRRVAEAVAASRADLLCRLGAIAGLRTWPAAANFALLQAPPGSALAARLAEQGIAVRPCDSFPGLSSDHLRIAVRTPAEHALLAAAIARVLGGGEGEGMASAAEGAARG
ncbi:MAG TPA: Rv2231c family pyridoxal phosphate-dependent protein CobC [Solirubrobacteraceae bacterium]|nr:Rv2231c family pyridoxal phosphate-dependent protein CobC [Solirubrobacteraceae bacterium]